MCVLRKSWTYFSQVQTSMTLWTMNSTIMCFFEEKPPMRNMAMLLHTLTLVMLLVFTLALIKEATLLTPYILVGEKILRVPHKYHLFSPVFKDDKIQFLEDASPAKKLKSNSEGNVIGDDINVNKLSEEFSAFESQMKLLLDVEI
ncbi:unnamed protein product [Fraxinus pennsylvanica]|uniref:Uncharacterized protein n=1 Tax=Fraxinus pennsylvanica TaxID=56036 RepID=A0AAD2A2R7_9LAMI|nr:unnamed protein product [Fraxinus pennsylvanica]